ncbi:MucR family transcriptional regulator [Hoeflea poritis]|uniref:MucR family transcriptional regulator n=1 Tax=Hoeflea poritis TaxID=2993659 RepID=A0ABT4VH45_9HYPH|nr:MucR family transcriptional regulator [Hoeflea poritis]MDA4844034.1 MucR family transcriptional regulator [Hoeflea poritis]
MNETMEQGREDRLVELTADVVAAYVSNNVVQTSDLPHLIAEVHSALGSTTATEEVKVDTQQKPAVNIKKSLQDDLITCLECGLKFKSLKRHLMTYHGLTPEAYRAKWNLPASYPMVAPAYAEKRSKLAKDMKLGHKRGK